MKKKLFLVCLLLLMGGLQTYAQNKPEKIITDANIVGHAHWYADTTYVLRGYVFVENGETLKIDPGTVVKGFPGSQASDASTLVVAQGGIIDAEGTAEKPIIFTAYSDDVNQLTPIDIDPGTRGLWGGLIILGYGKLATASTPDHIEGIPESEPRAAFGGNNDEDSSGVLKYVSIRYGGYALSPGNEINGLTLGGIGSKTVIDYIEIYNNNDDGVEVFGGRPRIKHFISAFNIDDSFDYDEGFRGEGQFWFAIMNSEQGIGNRAGEHDGGNNPVDAEPHSDPQIYNATYIGGGATSGNTAQDYTLIFRDDAAGAYYNSIFTDFPDSAISVEDLSSGVDSRQRLESGDLVLQNNIWYGYGAGNSPDQFIPQDFVHSYMTADSNGNHFTDPMLTGISRTNEGLLDPRPKDSSPAWTNNRTTPPDDGFFEKTDYIGAFGKDNWAAGWSFISQAGILESTPIEKHEIAKRPSQIALHQNYPNPFNPTTRIEYSLPAGSFVTLKVYDVTGREIATLVNSKQSAGNHSINFDASHFASGIYLYKLQVGDHSTIRKMTLIK